VAAQRLEFSASGGYSVSDGVDVTARPLLGQVFGHVSPVSGASFNFTAGVLVSEGLQLEFLFGRQSSRLEAGGPGTTTLPLADLTIYNYQGNIAYNFGPRDSPVRPFVFVGVGVTTYDFGKTLLAPPVGRPPTSLGSDHPFSSALGGGAKFYFFPHVGLRVAARWTATYIDTDQDGIWCDPFYGCWPTGDPQYSNQFDTSAGITVRF
jgi:hypothetical protein